jgi:L-lysine exporter family protein LysE/ArgO
VTLGGAAFLAVYAAWRSGGRSVAFGAGSGREVRAGSLKAAVLTCLAFTFLNPHVYLDTVLLVGGLSGRYEGTARLAFALGRWRRHSCGFSGWATARGCSSRMFAKPSAWRVLDGLIALVMASLSISLLVRFFTG